MTKLKKIIIVIVSVIVVALLFEATTYCIQSARLKKEGYHFSNATNTPPYPTNISTFSKHYIKYKRNDLFQNHKGFEYNSNPILIFGDVFANSFGLSEENNLTTKLADFSKRPVLNLADAGWTISHMYYMLKSEPMLRSIKNVDTILFVYDDDMKNRLTSFSFYPHHNYLYLKYKLEDGILLEDIPQIFSVYNSYFIRSVERFVGRIHSNSKNPNKQQELFRLMKTLFVQSKLIVSFMYPEFKNFVILRYVSKEHSLENLKLKSNDAIAQLEYNFWQQLKEDGFIVVETPELSESIDYTSSEYVFSDSSPNDKAWDEIIPKLVERF